MNFLSPLSSIAVCAFKLFALQRSSLYFSPPNLRLDSQTRPVIRQIALKHYHFEAEEFH